MYTAFTLSSRDGAASSGTSSVVTIGPSCVISSWRSTWCQLGVRGYKRAEIRTKQQPLKGGGREHERSRQEKEARVGWVKRQIKIGVVV